MDATFDLLTLALLPGLNDRKAELSVEKAPIRDVLVHPEDHSGLLAPPAIRALRTGAAVQSAEAELRRAAVLGVRIVGRTEEAYPTWLRRIYDPPLVLYVRGTLVPGEGGRSVTIVGSRAASPQGGALAETLARDLASRCGATIVSGLARGIDAAAHRGALDGAGRTVAVLGSGVDRVYPKENTALAEAIAVSGAVVSEFRFGTPPRPGHFPRRNRILAGWSRGTIVVEAGDKSGALVTARIALDEGREVMAVPGHPSYPGAYGTNDLIRDGARLVRDAADVAAELGWELPAAVPEAPVADTVLAVLRPGVPVSIEELVDRSGLPAPEVLARLAQLELGARVRRLPGALFLRS